MRDDAITLRFLATICEKNLQHVLLRINTRTDLLADSPLAFRMGRDYGAVGAMLTYYFMRQLS